MNDLAGPGVRLVRASDAEWRAAARLFDDFCYQLLPEYADRLASRSGAMSERHLVMRGDEVIAMAEARVRSFPLRSGGIAYIASGPAVRRRAGSPEEALTALRESVGALRKHFVDRRKLTLRVLCPIGDEPWNASAAAAVTGLGCGRAKESRGYRTILIDTTGTPEQINASFNKTWRKYLRRAERDGVTTRRAVDAAAFEHVVRLHDSLRERKGFGVTLDGGFYAELQAALPANDRLIVILAELQGEVVGMNLVSVQGDTLSGIIGATNEAGAEKNAAYLLEWDAVCLAVERGLKRYDLGGIDPEGNPGVYTFKKGTHGADVTAAGPFEIDPGPVRAAVRGAAERAYRIVKTRSLGR